MPRSRSHKLRPAIDVLLHPQALQPDARSEEPSLAFLEHSLETGEDLPPVFFEMRDSITADPNVKTLLENLSPQSAEQAEAALVAFEKLHLEAGGKAHVLKIFEANFLTNLGRGDEAISRFLDVLDQNPYIAGVWKDLGTVFQTRYHPGLAWKCFDVARKLNPQHRLLDEVAEREDQIRREFPEYFLVISP